MLCLFCAAFGSILPCRSLDAADADFSDGLWVSHDVFPPKKLRVCERFAHPQMAETAKP